MTQEQKQLLLKDLCASINSERWLSVESYHGEEWKEEQMLKDAKDGYVSGIIIRNDGDEEHYAVTYPILMEKDHIVLRTKFV